MARSQFGGTYQDWLMIKQGNLLALKTGTATLTFWSTWTGSGTPSGQYTDLLDQNNNPVSSIVVNGYQIPRFSGPDNVAGMWAWDGTGTDLFWMEARQFSSGGFIEDPLNPGFYLPAVDAVTAVTLGGTQTISGPKTFTAAKNIFTGKEELNGGFTNTYDTALWIAPTARSNPTNNSQGLYVQHRVSDNLGGLVHDAAASELRLNNATNTGSGQSAHENSLVVTGGANTIGRMTASLANFHTEGTPSGTISEVALFRGTQIPALTGTATIDKVYGLYLDDQIVGATENYSMYALGKCVVPFFVPKDSTSVAVIARARSDTVGGTQLLAVQNATPTTLFQVTQSGTGGMGGSVSGCSFWVNNNLATGSTVALRVRAHSSQSVNVAEFQESGGTAHIVVTAATSAKRANLVMASSAIAQASTDGFLYASSMAGAPSGTPTAFTGTVPIVIDTTNSKLMAYIGGAWKGITLT